MQLTEQVIGVKQGTIVVARRRFWDCSRCLDGRGRLSADQVCLAFVATASRSERRFSQPTRL